MTPIAPKVVDVSHYESLSGNGWQDVRRSGIIGAICKSSEGNTVIDDRYEGFVAGARAAGLLTGAYHFLRPGDMSREADFFLRCARPDDKTLISCDYEVASVSAGDARQFIEHVEAKIGRKVVLYSGNTIKEKLGDRVDPWWAARRLWLAQYSAKWIVQRSWTAPWLWQFTGDGIGRSPHTVPGLHASGGLDISSYAGTDEQLRLEWVNDATHAPVPVTPPPIVTSAGLPAVRHEGIIATEEGERQTSAYGGMVDVNAPGCALPARFRGERPRVRVVYRGAEAVVPIVDIGPHFTDNPYWQDLDRPRAEGTRGSNRAGIDLTTATMAALDVPGRENQRTITLDYWEFA